MLHCTYQLPEQVWEEVGEDRQEVLSSHDARHGWEDVAGALDEHPVVLGLLISIITLVTVLTGGLQQTQ